MVIYSQVIAGSLVSSVEGLPQIQGNRRIRGKQRDGDRRQGLVHADGPHVRGIGRGIALALARQGVHIAVVDLFTPTQGTAGYNFAAEQDVLHTVTALEELDVRAIGVPVDVTNMPQVEAMVQTATQQLGPIDIVCNNAGVIDTGLAYR